MIERPAASVSAIACAMSICPWRSSAPSKEEVTVRSASMDASPASERLMTRRQWNMQPVQDQVLRHQNLATYVR